MVSGPSFGGFAPRILHFDIECRPLSWYGGDFVTREITAIAALFRDEDEGYVWLLGVDDPVDMLLGFTELYDAADVVTGHFIRGFDLPNIQGALDEYRLEALGAKWTVDTKLDHHKRQGMSNSQENIAAELEIEAPKVQMNQPKWRAGNRLTPEGIAFTRDRAIGDVKQHVEMYDALQAEGRLGEGKVWSPAAGNGKRYTP